MTTVIPNSPSHSPLTPTASPTRASARATQHLPRQLSPLKAKYTPLLKRRSPTSNILRLQHSSSPSAPPSSSIRKMSGSSHSQGRTLIPPSPLQITVVSPQREEQVVCRPWKQNNTAANNGSTSSHASPLSLNLVCPRPTTGNRVRARVLQRREGVRIAKQAQQQQETPSSFSSPAAENSHPELVPNTKEEKAKAKRVHFYQLTAENSPTVTNSNNSHFRESYNNSMKRTLSQQSNDHDERNTTRVAIAMTRTGGGDGCDDENEKENESVVGGGDNDDRQDVLVDWNRALKRQLLCDHRHSQQQHNHNSSNSSNHQGVTVDMTMIKFKSEEQQEEKHKNEDNDDSGEIFASPVSPNKKQKMCSGSFSQQQQQQQLPKLRELLYSEPYEICKQITSWKCSYNVILPATVEEESSTSGQSTATTKSPMTSTADSFFQFLRELINHFDESKLRELQISRNYLERLEFPAEMTLPTVGRVISIQSGKQFTALKILRLSHNSLRELPLHFWKTFPHLEELDVSFNQLQELCYESCSEGDSLVQHLKVLNVSHNKLHKVSEDLFNDLFPFLLELDAAGDRPMKKSRLRELNMSNNELTRLPKLFIRSENDESSTSPMVSSSSQKRTAFHKHGRDLQEQSKQCHVRIIDLQFNKFRRIPSLSVLEQLSELGLQKFDIRFNLFDSDQVNWTSMPSHVKQLLVCLQDTFPVEVIPNLYVGGLQSARNYPLLKEKNIQYILNAAHKEDIAHFPHLFKQVVILTALDSEEQDMIQFFDMAHDMINKAINEEKCGILVHCIAGQSRSVAIIISYLMRHKNMTFNEALEFVQSRRRVAQPNTAFQIQLMEYEHTLSQERLRASSEEE